MIVALLLLGFIAPEGLAGLASIWLSVWIGADDGSLSATLFYLGVYGAMTLGAMGLVFGLAQ